MTDTPERDERIAIPLDPEVALKALFAVDPDDDGQDDREPAKGAKGADQT